MDGAPLLRIASRRSQGRSVALISLCLAVLVAQVDTAVVNLAVRSIGDYFSASVNALQWVVDSYNLVYAVLLLTGGLLADLKGRRLIFMIGGGIFAVGSVVCAFASSVGVLIAGRTIAGAGAALLIPASLALLRVVWPDPSERRRALGIWAACNGLALAIGPTLGGVLIHHFGWPSIFIVVIPIILAALILAMLAIPESSDPRDRDFDPMAQLLGALALSGLAFAAIECRTAPMIAALSIVTAVISLAVFIRIERKKGAAALVPLDMFRIRRFRGAVTATAGMTFGMYGTLFLLPLTWQSTGRLDTTTAGLALMPMALVFVLISPFSGILTKKLGIQFMTGGGVLTIGCGLLLIAFGAPGSSILPAELGLAMTGLGMGLATGPLMEEAVGAVAVARSGTASALINVARMVGATIGVAILGALFALVHGGPVGLRLAMIIGGLVQIASAAFAWKTIRQQADKT
jgi:EmrB/QacA subfamily drug resistance transporter